MDSLKNTRRRESAPTLSFSGFSDKVRDMQVRFKGQFMDTIVIHAIYTPIPNIVVRAESNKQEADDHKGLWESPN